MPSINLGKRKKRESTENKKGHQDIYQDKRWKRLVAVKKKEDPLCEACLWIHVIKQVQEVHHKIPFEFGITTEEKEMLAFDLSNLWSLCTECHKIVENLIRKSIFLKDKFEFLIRTMKALFNCPDGYHQKAKDQMADIVKNLNKEKFISKLDIPALAMLAYSYDIYFKAAEILLRDGIVMEDSQNQQPTLPGMEPTFISKMKVTKAHPALRIATDAQNQITKLLIEFNLTPRSRKKITDPVTPEPQSPADKFIKNKIETR
jgi:P27 family predicted phage terminase small subunit